MIRMAERQHFIAIADALDNEQRRMLRAVAPEQTPLAPLLRLADIHPIAATVERDGKPVVVHPDLWNTRPSVLALQAMMSAIGGSERTGIEGGFVFDPTRSWRSMEHQHQFRVKGKLFL